MKRCKRTKPEQPNLFSAEEADRLEKENRKAWETPYTVTLLGGNVLRTALWVVGTLNRPRGKKS
jgi:hypothetical protein